MQSFFNGLAGMFNFSKSLDNVSNNISNMNTPGFKGNDVFIRSLGGDDAGYGATLEDKSLRTQQGDLKQTGNDTDLAINGDGYFVLKDENDQIFYTRAGQFKFNDKNMLVDSTSGMNVMAVGSNGLLEKIDITDNKILLPAATTAVNLVGNLSSGTASGATYTINGVNVFDSKGVSYTLSADFVKDAAPAADSWTVNIKAPDGTVLTTFNAKFNTDSSPLAGSNTFTQSLMLGGTAQYVTFNLGNPGSLAGATQGSGSSNLGAQVKDGHDALGLRSLSIDEDGVIQFKYIDGQTKVGQQVALAAFDDASVLETTTNGMYKSNIDSTAKYGKPNKGQYGSIQSKSIEMSNVDLTQEFADILIIQRGYQASSRIMSVSNDLLDQLYNSTRSK